MKQGSEIRRFCTSFTYLDDRKPIKGKPSGANYWRLNEDGTELHASDDDFPNHHQWLKFFIDRCFVPWGCTVNGEACWDGGDLKDIGKIVVEDNVVTVKKGKVSYG